MRCDKETMRLYAVTDRAWTGEQTLLEQVDAALKGGITCLQLREKDLPEEMVLKEALEIKGLCRRYQVPFIIDDNVQIAVKCNADGVHIGQHDLEAGSARALLGKDKILGVSAHTISQALAAQAAGADYLGVGSVFPTKTKADVKDVSYDTLKRICEAVEIPVVAIGGINRGNIEKLSGSKIDGVALVSAVFSAKDIERECSQLLALVKKAVSA